MNSKRPRLDLASIAGLLIVMLAGLTAQPASAGARNPCQEAGNLTQNCGFDVFVDQSWNGKRLQIPQGWGYFVLSGDLDFRPADDTYWGAPSLWLLSDGVPFTAGIYQQVKVTPGVVYQADAGWAAVTQPNFERKIGLDPTGGADPLAPSVVWGPSEWGINSWPDLTVSARATGPTMTVFVWANHPQTYGNDWLFIDAVGLWPDASQPAATVTPKPSLTPTRKPPTRTPPPATPTLTPTDLPSPTPADTETPTVTPPPTETPTASPTPTGTPTPTPATPTLTPQPSRTPLPTVVPVAVVLQTAEAERSGGGGGAFKAGESFGSALLAVVVLALVVGAALVGLLLWLWLRPRKATDNHGELEDDE